MYKRGSLSGQKTGKAWLQKAFHAEIRGRHWRVLDRLVINGRHFAFLRLSKSGLLDSSHKSLEKALKESKVLGLKSSSASYGRATVGNLPELMSSFVKWDPNICSSFAKLFWGSCEITAFMKALSKVSITIQTVICTTMLLSHPAGLAKPITPVKCRCFLVMKRSAIKTTRQREKDTMYPRPGCPLFEKVSSL